MGLTKVTLTPKLGVLQEVFLGRCAGIYRSIDEFGCEPITTQVLSDLRRRFLCPLPSPTRAQLRDELSLLTALSVVIDLIAQGWTFAAVSPEVVLEFRPTTSPEVEKERLKRAHQIERDFQLHETSVRAFIQGMEKRRLTKKGWHSIYSVMRDGRELAEKLEGLLALSDPELQTELIARIIRPYLQFVGPNDICEHTGLRLGDVWRYFRHTWSNTYKSIPGRSMMILVRDAAAPFHPVVGIAALGSSVVQQKARDKWIGWDAGIILNRFREKPSRRLIRWLDNQLDSIIKGVYKRDFLREGFLTRANLNHPSDEIIKKLWRESQKAIKRHRLYPHAAKHKNATTANEVDWQELAETNLFRSKRARILSTALTIRQVFLQFKLCDGSVQEFRDALTASRFRNAIVQLCRLLKAERVGINMMDITVCGAIAPYNTLLGGKLVCMLLCSPEVVREYRGRYGGQESLIASSMRGRSVRREAKLTLLCTTSLYGSSLSQYSRVKVPAQHIGGQQNEVLEYRELGVSEGFGSFHFSAETLRLIEILLSRSNYARKVNSIFGEGVNPLMRKIREGLSILGLPGDELLRHGNKRVVYGVALARNFREVLIGLSAQPEYLLPMTKLKCRTELLADYWRQRWLLKRLQKFGVLEEVQRHTCVYPIQHGAQVKLPLKNDANLRFWAKAAN